MCLFPTHTKLLKRPFKILHYPNWYDTYGLAVKHYNVQNNSVAEGIMTNVDDKLMTADGAE